MRAIAVAGNLDAHGFFTALDLPAKGIGAIATAAYDDKISSASIVGMHTHSNRQCCGGSLPIGDFYEVRATLDNYSCQLMGGRTQPAARLASVV
jgi:hypothetical protein